MTRRNFLKKSIGGGALLTLATPALSQTATSLRLLSADAENSEQLKARIEAATDGNLSIDVQNVEQGDAPSLLSKVANDEADLALVPLHRFIDQNLALGMFASMPFGLSADELEGWISASEGGDMMQMLLEEFGVSARLVTNKGTLPIWSKAPIEDLATLKTLKIGSRGLGIRSLQAIGSGSVSDLDDPSTSKAEMDVLEGVSILEMQAGGLIDTFSNVTSVNPNTPTSLSVLIASNKAMAGMAENHRLVLESACSAELARSRGKAFHDEAVALAEAKSGIEINDLPDDVWNGLHDGATTVLKDIFDSGQVQASVVDSYVYFLTDVARWSDIGEAAYYAGRKRLATL